MDYVKSNFLSIPGVDSIYAYWIDCPQLLSLSLSFSLSLSLPLKVKPSWLDSVVGWVSWFTYTRDRIRNIFSKIYERIEFERNV